MYRFEPYKKEVDPEWNLFVATLLGFFFFEKEEFKRIKGWIIVEVFGRGWIYGIFI